MCTTRILPLSAVLVLAGMTSTSCSFSRYRDNYKFEKPTVAVVAFENRARPPHGWTLGEGVADLLAHALFETGRFRVLERENVDDVLIEQEFQAQGRTRREGRIPPNRLKNARYLVRGTITEFAHISQEGFDVGVGSFRFGSGGEHAVVSVILKLVDVESAEILFSKTVNGNIYAGVMDAGIYDNMSFGGQHFFQTPLGEALSAALEEAVSTIDETIGRTTWQPLIANVSSQRIVITGGAVRRLEIGSRWQVRGASTPIYDPESGDLLGQEPGTEVGRLVIVDVQEKYAIARPTTGSGFERGQRLFRLEAPPTPSNSGEPPK